MRASASRALYVCYYNVDEPLVRTQVLAYLRALTKEGYSLHLLTFEKARLSRERRDAIRSELERDGIAWYSLRYHRWPSLPATLYDIAVGALAASWISRRFDIRLLHVRSHVGAAIGLPLKALGRSRLLFDVRGLLADEYVDAGHWSRGGLKYRLTKGMERIFFRFADAFVVLTNVFKHDLESEPALQRRRDEITVIPCCVELPAFRSDSGRRERDRLRRGWQGRRVLVYLGKLGGFYLVKELVSFFGAARTVDASYFLQVWTQGDPSLIVRELQAQDVPSDAYAVGFAPPRDVPRLIQAGDAGLSFIRSGPSKRSSSPTKVGEYLAAGLPVVSTAGIGDCDTLLNGSGLGLIVKSHDNEEYRRVAEALTRLLDDRDTAARCRAFAAQQLSIERVAGPRYAAVYRRLLGEPYGRSGTPA